MQNPFTPPKPDTVKSFMESVQSPGPALRAIIQDTRRHAFHTLGNFISATVNGVLAVPKGIIHLTGNILATPSAILHKTGSIIGKIGSGFHSAIQSILPEKSASASAHAKPAHNANAASGHDGHGGGHGGGHH